MRVMKMQNLQNKKKIQQKETEKIKERKSRSLARRLGVLALCGTAVISTVPVYAVSAEAAENQSVETEAAPFTLEEDTNTAGVKGLWKDIAPEGSLKGNSSYQIKAVRNAASRTSYIGITWKSSDPEIASVDQNGYVTGHKEGHADITASSGTYSQKFGINVKIPSDEPYTIQNGVLSYTSEKLGKKYHLSVKIPSDGSIKWNGIVSSDTQNALIIKNGTGGGDYYISEGKTCTFRTTPKDGMSSSFTLSPASAGTAKARSDGQDSVAVTLNAPATLTVNAVPTVYATGISAMDDFIMKVGETVTLSSTVTPANATVVPGWTYKEQSDYWKNYTSGMPDFENVIQFNGTRATAVRTGTANFVVSIPSGQGKSISDSVMITVVDQSARLFDDVRKLHSYYYEPVYWALDNNVASGTSETTFSPGARVTRGQIAMFLWKAAGSPEPSETEESPFTDVSTESPFYKAISWAVQNGITSGTSESTFGPNQPCTRAQIVTFIYQYKGCPKVDENAVSQKFSDVAEGSYYENAVYYAVANGITSGIGNNEFGSGQTCTRAQAVTFLYRALKDNA